jgi:predicted nucleotidyltransferase
MARQRSLIKMSRVQQEAREHRKTLIRRLNETIPLLRERGVEKILVYGSILDEKRFQWISDIDLALSGKRFSFREQLRILSLLEEVFGADGFDAVFLTGEELAPREAVLESILREGVDAEQLVKSTQDSDRGRALESR